MWNSDMKNFENYIRSVKSYVVSTIFWNKEYPIGVNVNGIHFHFLMFHTKKGKSVSNCVTSLLLVMNKNPVFDQSEILCIVD